MAGNYSKKERTSYKKGFWAGFFSSKKKGKRKTNRSFPTKRKAVHPKKSKKDKRAELLEYSEDYRKRNLGALFYDGKYYDTNFKGDPIEITKAELQDLHKSYDSDNNLSDMEVADRYVKHMRRKFGVFDSNDKFLCMTSEEKSLK